MGDGATPSANAQPGSEQWIANQMKAERKSTRNLVLACDSWTCFDRLLAFTEAEKQAAAAKLAEASKPVAYEEMKPFQIKKLLKERGQGDFKGTKQDMIAKLEGKHSGGWL